MTRDRWLADLANKISPLFRAADHPLPHCIISVGEIHGLTTAHYKEGYWHIKVSDRLDDKIVAAETLIHNLVFRACGNDTGQKHLMTLIGYESTQQDGDKLAWGCRAAVRTMPPYPRSDGCSREGWLTRLVEELRPLFVDAGHPLPEEITAQPGWFSLGYPRQGMIQYTSGECHVYIWPSLSESLSAALALVNELPRCAVGAVDVPGSDQTIREVAIRIGLNSHCDAEPTAALIFLLNNIIADLGPYPEK